MRETYPVTCSRDCSGGCPLQAVVENGRVVKIGNNPLGSPYMTGCINGFQMPRTLYHPDRLKKPLIQTGERGSDQFREASWEEALDLIAAKLEESYSKYGPHAVLNLVGTGSVNGFLHNTYNLPSRFFALLGGYTGFSGSYSAGAWGFVRKYLFGSNPPGYDPGVLQHSNQIILWGANIADTRFGCEVPGRIREAADRGARIIVIDPRKTNSVKRFNAEWIPCKPGTDTAMMLAVLHHWLTKDQIDWNVLNRYTVGIEDLLDYISGKTDGQIKDAQWAMPICGVPAEKIKAFADAYMEIKPTALIPGYSIQRTLGGEETFRMSTVLQAASGNLPLPGGSTGAGNTAMSGPRIGFMEVPDWDKQPTIPILRWPDAILEGKQGGYPSDIEVLYTVGSNYLNQGSDVNKNIRAMQKVGFSVAHDYFLTPTARYCDVVLPVAVYLERNDIVNPTSGNYLLFSNKVCEPPEGVRSDYEIFCELAKRMGIYEAYSENRTEEDWLRKFVAESEIPDFETFRKEGIYFGEDQKRMGLQAFFDDPEKNPISTPSGKIEIRSEKYAADTGFSAIPQYRSLPENDECPLILITPKSKYRIHSQGSNIDWLREREPQELWMHPDDANSRDIHPGDRVLVFNDIGRSMIPVKITDEITPGVVSLYEGVWVNKDKTGVDTAGSANILSSTMGTEPSKSTTTHTIHVQVEKYLD